MGKIQSAWRSPWVIGLTVMGVIFVTANFYLIYLAGDRAPSLVAENYYERGQDYEKNMLKRLAKDPGWKMTLTPPAKISLKQPAEFQFSLLDKEGKVVTPDSVTLFAYRPSDSRADFSTEMSRLAPGNYQVKTQFPLKGYWDLLASVKDGEEEFNISLRIFVEEN
ncbi:FixH family protein [Motiliproteus sp. MSK22-1]|uniref:FixH family protein n=1 Tax=Motiliproteus sp. MSK22-1 TaxID=1897630 RepID=UPI00097635F1|nr:FixH family protein [Motiliproteus sp. MSK22-1]OMH38748.1 hypothetical protein BGP75_06055 [Motiliproteus sp. MSK22-1]